MKITTTDGKEYYFIENCPYCNPTTAGQHRSDCPNFQPPSRLFTPPPWVNPGVRISEFGDEGDFVKEFR